jgi:hypothetical protein
MRAARTVHFSTGRRIAAVALVSLLVSLAAPAAAQTASAPLPPAKEIIARFVAATNSPAVMAKHSSLRSKGRFEVPGAGVAGDLEIAQARPNKIVTRVALPGMGEVVRGYDGTTGWSLDPMSGPRLLGGRELDAVREDSDFGTPSRQGPNVASAETLERTEMNGEACYKVKVVWKSGREVLDCYSVATGLLIASVSTQESQMGSVEVTNLIGDYKDFGGQKIATRLRQQAMGQEQVMTIESVEYDAADSSMFEMPPAIKALAGKKP